MATKERGIVSTEMLNVVSVGSFRAEDSVENND